MTSTILHKIHTCKSEVFTLGELAQKINATVQGSPDVKITGVGTIANAKSGEITFLAGSKYRSYLKATRASAVILTPEEAPDCAIPALICADPKLAFASIVHLLYPFQTVAPLLHKSAVIGSDCEIDSNSYIGPHCVIGNGVKIASGVILQAGCFIGDNCEIGENSVFHAHVSVYHGCKIANNCTLHSGVVIGSDGFGFANNKGQWLKVPQIGAVTIGERVEIGANTTIDRGAIEDTEIANDVILDNLIQIAHNVKIGEGTAIAACVGIAGSTVIGKHCLIGGGSRINGHITIADGTHLVGCSNVASSITEPGIYGSGLDINDFKTWRKNLARFHQLDSLAKRLIALERKIAKASQQVDSST